MCEKRKKKGRVDERHLVVDGRQGEGWNYDDLCACSACGAPAAFLPSFGKRAANLESRCW